ncbi:MAG: hypothetical protein IJT19_07560 [Bacteroidaceae bacterium]|nr:hypothetical protein [Bacteroidaceae bacterium]
MTVTFNNEEQRFVFDFEHDGTEDIVSLTGDGYQVEAFGHCFYYGYEFIYRFAQPSSHKMELLKALPANISFDMDAYEKQYLDDVLENGRPRYTEVQKEEVKHSINQMLYLIHRKDYFTIAKDVKKSRFRPYMM